MINVKTETAVVSCINDIESNRVASIVILKILDLPNNPFIMDGELCGATDEGYIIRINRKATARDRFGMDLLKKLK